MPRNNNPCGSCADCTPAPIIPVCSNSEYCSMILPDKCIVHKGATLVNLAMVDGTRLDVILAAIDSRLAETNPLPEGKLDVTVFDTFVLSNTTALNNKVDKVTGKGLSTEDYTTPEKTKLANILGTNTGDQNLSGLVPKITTITINGVTQDLSTNRSFTISGGGSFDGTLTSPNGTVYALTVDNDGSLITTVQ